MKRIQPKPGQESVWDYPRPPKIERTSAHIRIVCEGEVIADSNSAFRILETSHPPVYYIPQSDIKMQFLTPAEGKTSFCEWKGKAHYWQIEIGERTIRDAAWSYPSPNAKYAALKDHLAFYPSRVDACFVNDERVSAQPGDFYGGWITSDIVGPFKGSRGTWGW